MKQLIKWIGLLLIIVHLTNGKTIEFKEGVRTVVPRNRRTNYLEIWDSNKPNHKVLATIPIDKILYVENVKEVK